MWFWLALCVILITTLFAIVTIVFYYIDKKTAKKYLLATLILCAITFLILVQKPSQTVEYSSDYAVNDQKNGPRETSSSPKATTATKDKNNKKIEIQPPKPHQPDSGDTNKNNSINTEAVNISKHASSNTSENKPDKGPLETIAPQPEAAKGGTLASTGTVKKDMSDEANKAGKNDSHAAAIKTGKIKDHVNLREYPGMNSKVIKVLPPDTPVDLQSPYNANNWVKVRETNTKQEGWVFGRFIETLD